MVAASGGKPEQLLPLSLEPSELFTFIFLSMGVQQKDK